MKPLLILLLGLTLPSVASGSDIQLVGPGEGSFVLSTAASDKAGATAKLGNISAYGFSKSIFVTIGLPEKDRFFLSTYRREVPIKKILSVPLPQAVIPLTRLASPINDVIVYGDTQRVKVVFLGLNQKENLRPVVVLFDGVNFDIVTLPSSLENAPSSISIAESNGVLYAFGIGRLFKHVKGNDWTPVDVPAVQFNQNFASIFGNPEVMLRLQRSGFLFGLGASSAVIVSTKSGISTVALPPLSQGEAYIALYRTSGGFFALVSNTPATKTTELTITAINYINDSGSILSTVKPSGLSWRSVWTDEFSPRMLYLELKNNSWVVKCVNFKDGKLHITTISSILHLPPGLEKFYAIVGPEPSNDQAEIESKRMLPSVLYPKNVDVKSWMNSIADDGMPRNVDPKKLVTYEDIYALHLSFNELNSSVSLKTLDQPRVSIDSPLQHSMIRGVKKKASVAMF